MSHEHDQAHAHLDGDNYQMEASRWTTGRNVLVFAALISVIGCVRAATIRTPTRFFRSYMVAFAFTAAIGLGAFFFVMVQFLTGSAWSVTVRRIMENIMFTLPFGALAVYSRRVRPEVHLFLDRSGHGGGESRRCSGKPEYLTRELLRAPHLHLLRAVVDLDFRDLAAIDQAGYGTSPSGRCTSLSRWSAPGLFLAVVVGTLASYDWLMSLEPNWYSTIFGLYILVGRRADVHVGRDAGVPGFPARRDFSNMPSRVEHYHDLGSGCSRMTAFYTYIAFSQYLLIWYANLPEETIWYPPSAWWEAGCLDRLAMPFIRFIIPFFIAAVPPGQAQPDA